MNLQVTVGSKFNSGRVVRRNTMTKTTKEARECQPPFQAQCFLGRFLGHVILSLFGFIRDLSINTFQGV